jgi:hypothetical protein
MDIQFSSFSILHVPPMIKMKTQKAKNKVFKPRYCVGYLTLNVILILPKKSVHSRAWAM